MKKLRLLKIPRNKFNNKWALVTAILVLLCILLIVGVVDITNLEESVREGYDIPFWTAASTIGTIGSISIAMYAIYQNNLLLSKQLEIEQTPFVVMQLEGRDTITLKNIGRGMARRVIIFTKRCWNENHQIPFFTANSNHSYEIGQSESVENISISNAELVFEKATDGSENSSIYIFFSDQLGNSYRVKVHLSKISQGFKVMAYNYDPANDKISAEEWHNCQRKCCC